MSIKFVIPMLGAAVIWALPINAAQPWQQTRAFQAAEAFQAAAASDGVVFAISSRSVGKYSRSGKRLATSVGDAKHLNSGFVWKGTLYCAHSNYPATPEMSEVKALDPSTMRLSTIHRFGDVGGSLTWVVRHRSSWWCNFAKYGDANQETFLAQFDDNWRELQRWTYPASVIKQLGRYSLSGGAWHVVRFNELPSLIVSGHDKRELYELKLPSSGSELVHVGTIAVPFHGQGFALDPTTGGLVGIQRANRKIVFAQPGAADHVELPTRGVCAHRGASDTHPENTLSALREALRLGAHMIEFDVALSQDNQLVLMHDTTVDRTTDGSGQVADKTLQQLKQLDAGAWKGMRFQGEQIPTLAEALAVMPENVWLNIHLKGGADLARAVAREVLAAQRTSQAFLACDAVSARAARAECPDIRICNMERQANALPYIEKTIEADADFIQLLGGSVDPNHTRLLRDSDVKINYCCVNDAQRMIGLLESGVEFPLVDHLDAMLQAAEQTGVARSLPVYRSRLPLPWAQRPLSIVRQHHTLNDGRAGQGVAIGTAENGVLRHYTSNAKTICEFDSDWNLLATKEIRVPGVNHLGAIDFHDGYLWAGMLAAPEGNRNESAKRSVIAKIRGSDLRVVNTWELTQDLKWIDPVCFDGERLWVGDLSDLGIHCYRQKDGNWQRIGTLRYPKAMHFSQGLRVRGNQLYSMHTFGAMDGLFEFNIPDDFEAMQEPQRVWHIPESRQHLEGFAFVPGSEGEILHAQGDAVDRIQLLGWKQP